MHCLFNPTVQELALSSELTGHPTPNPHTRNHKRDNQAVSGMLAADIVLR